MEENKKSADIIVEKTTDKKTKEAENKKAQTEKLINDLLKELNELQDELDNKKYLVDGGKKIADEIKLFITKKAKWKFTEALGIIEVIKALDKFINDHKSKDFMIGPLELEAIYYFLSKHEDVGLDTAEPFVKLLKAINLAKSRKDADNKKFEELQFRISSLQHGVDPEDVKEQNNEQES